jgi:hypothetical protein
MAFWLLGAGAYAQGSVLATGNWYQIGVVRSGIHRLDAAFLQKLGLPVNNLNPRNIRLYGNGGGMLPQLNRTPRPQDLTENAIYVAGEQDGRFDNGDYVLFYAQGPHTIQYNADTKRLGHQTHLYSDTAYYFLTLSDAPGARVTDQPSLAADRPIRTFDDYVFHEQEERNLLQSGREWFGETFDFNPELTLNFNLPDLVPEAAVYVRSSVMAAAPLTTQFQIQLNGQALGSQTITPISGARYDYKGFRKDDLFTGTVPASGGASLHVKLTYDRQANNASRGYLDFIGLQTQRQLKLSGSQTTFRSIESTQGVDARFEVDGAQANSRIWDVTDPMQPKNQAFTLQGDVASFGAETTTLREFVIFADTREALLDVPVSGWKIANQNLHGMATPQLLIVTHPLFQPQAERLAQFRRSHDGLSVEIVTTTEIFNEFSSGKADVSAIRDFARFLYDQSPEIFRYLLLLGDASYDYKNRVTNQTAFVPVYESRESLHPIFSYSSDDYFGFMEPDEGDWTESNLGDHTMEIGVGRIPARSADEAKWVVDKLIHYATGGQALGKWRNRISFVADDGDANTHQLDADRLAQGVTGQYPQMNVDKIYVDAFPQVITASGQLAPRVQETINWTVNQGSLIVNYTGHGGESGWAEEKILTIGNILSWKNYDNLPLFVTATCEFGRYDDPARTSGAEMILLKKNNGGIGLVTTTRPVFSNTNYYLNQAFYQAVFEPTATGMPRLGDIVRQTKNNSLSGSVNRNFSLLGDPSMRLAYPQHEAVLTHLNGKSLEDDLNEGIDTLKALSLITLSGEIRQRNTKNRLESFNGEVFVTIHDKPTQMSTLGTENDGRPSDKMNFELRKNLIFEGKASVSQGMFSLSFVVPKDIDYRFGKGKISFYAQSKQNSEDAGGAFTEAVVGGSGSGVSTDQTPPVVRLFMNDTTFMNGGTVQRDANLLALLSDENGINLSVGGIGHEITAVLNDGEEFIVLNDHYSASLNTYQTGRVFYPFKNLPLGKNTLRLKAWDTYNNSTEATLDFIVTENASLEIKSVWNYPNPLQTGQHASTTFSFEHNRVGEDLATTIEIFDRLGRKLKTLSAQLDRSESPCIAGTWDGTTEGGDIPAPGIYIYRLTTRSLQDGISTSKSNKILLLK